MRARAKKTPHRNRTLETVVIALEAGGSYGSFLSPNLFFLLCCFRSVPNDAAGSGAADACDGAATPLLAARRRAEAAEQGAVARVSQDRHRDDHHQKWTVSGSVLVGAALWMICTDGCVGD